ncbi:MAG: ribosome biogenesis protein [Candidatus Altiarchaeales archaeon ex4484_96]|nr:MAG: ribosome biogenesis protein [Candidatus Altiarchaeales archaeon ex4484_96]
MHLLKCPRCHQYTLKEECPACGIKAVNPKPARFAPQDPYGKYRRLMKKGC